MWSAFGENGEDSGRSTFDEVVSQASNLRKLKPRCLLESANEISSWVYEFESRWDVLAGEIDVRDDVIEMICKALRIGAPGGSVG